MATHFSILAWEIPWTEEPGGLQSMGSQRVGHHRARTQLNKTSDVNHSTQEKKKTVYNITHYYRNADQKYNSVSPHTGQNGHQWKIHEQ